MSWLRRRFKYSFNNVTLILIAINAGIFLLSSMNRNIIIYGALIPELVVQEHFYWQIFTYMFLHANMNHLFFNMLGLFFFGTQVERRIGSKEFLLFYLVTGTLAGLFSFFVYIFTGASGVILLGASGAIYGVLLAFAALYPYARIFVFGLIPVQAPILVAVYTIIEIFSQLSGTGSNVAHLTHLAGFFFAYLYLLIRMRVNPLDIWRQTRR